MRAWWSVLLVPHRRAHLQRSSDCSLLCLDEPTMKSASGPLSLRMASSLFEISSYAWSQEMRCHLPPASFIGYLRRCESCVMPCSRTEAPFAQCAPRLSGESNTGSWRTQTPFCTTASIAHPTEQWVQTVRFTSGLPSASVFASAWPIMLNGSCEATAPAPTVMPERFRKSRRSIVLTAHLALGGGLSRRDRQGVQGRRRHRQGAHLHPAHPRRVDRNLRLHRLVRQGAGQADRVHDDAGAARDPHGVRAGSRSRRV